MYNTIVVKQIDSKVDVPDFITADKILAVIELEEDKVVSNSKLFKHICKYPEDYLIIIDSKSAFLFNEILAKQKGVVILPHECNLTADISQYNWYNEVLCINNGVWFWYSDDVYKDPNNRKILNVINVKDNLFTEEQYNEIVVRNTLVYLLEPVDARKYSSKQIKL